MEEVYKKYWQNAFDFSSSTTRRDFWMTVLASFIASFIIGFILGIFFPYEYRYNLLTNTFDIGGSSIGMMINSLWTLANIIPGLAINIRRMHDINKSGWWIFITIIPIIGWIWYFILLITPGKSN